ncbi:MAG: hypothetical protein ACRCX8_09955 [Sarcina sp.]
MNYTTSQINAIRSTVGQMDCSSALSSLADIREELKLAYEDFTLSLGERAKELDSIF